MAFKIYNPDPVEIKVRLYDAVITVPSRGYAIVSTVLGVQEAYPALEVKEVDDSELNEFRAKQAKVTKEAEKIAEIKAEADAKREKEEAKRVNNKIKARAKGEEDARTKASEEKIALITGEKESIDKLAGVLSVDKAKVAEKPQTHKKGK